MATENPLPCHIGPNGAQALSLVGSLIPICPAFTPPIGGFGLSQPRVRRKTPEEQHEARRLYDKTRSQKPERKEAMRLYAKKFQEERKVASLCVACGNQAIPGQTRCEACRDKHNQSRNQAAERKPRAPKLTPEERIEARREYELTRSQTPGRKEAARLRAEKQRQKRRAARLAPPEQGTTVLKSLKVASCALG